MPVHEVQTFLLLFDVAALDPIIVAFEVTGLLIIGSDVVDIVVFHKMLKYLHLVNAEMPVDRSLFVYCLQHLPVLLLTHLDR